MFERHGDLVVSITHVCGVLLRCIVIVELAALSLSVSHFSFISDCLSLLLRLLTLWFDYGHLSDVCDALSDGIKTVDIDNWLQVT